MNDDEQAALLAELKGISNDNSSASRFNNETDENKVISNPNPSRTHKSSGLKSKSSFPWQNDLDAWKASKSTQPVSNENQNSSNISSGLRNLEFSGSHSPTVSSSKYGNYPSAKGLTENITPTRKTMLSPKSLSENRDETPDKQLINQDTSRNSPNSSRMSSGLAPVKELDLKIKYDDAEINDVIDNLPEFSPTNKSPNRQRISGNDEESQVSHAESGNDFLTSLPDMFDQGENEDSDDEQLLAELRAISTKSNSETNSFDEENFENEDASKSTINTDKLFEQLERVSAQSSGSDCDVTINKDEGVIKTDFEESKKSQNRVVDVESEGNNDASLSSQKRDDADKFLPWKRNIGSKDGAKNDLSLSMEKSFGDFSEEDDLLAKLRGISASNYGRVDDIHADSLAKPDVLLKGGKATAAKSDQFDNTEIAVRATANKKIIRKQESVSLSKSEKRASEESSNIENAPEIKSGGLLLGSSTESSNNGFQSSMPKTFEGERGGSAQDDDLLAELRAISAKSTSYDRFAEDESDIGMNAKDNSTLQQPVSQPKENPGRKQKKTSSNATNFNRYNKAEITVSATVSEEHTEKQESDSLSSQDSPNIENTSETKSGGLQSNSSTQSSNNGFQSSMPKTFNGERGGSATDDDLLAELRAISAKSSKTDRFGEDESTIGMNAENSSTFQQPVSQVKENPKRQPKKILSPKKRTGDELPTWKGKDGKANTAKSEDFDNIEIAVPATTSSEEHIRKQELDSLPKSEVTPSQDNSNIKNTSETKSGGLQSNSSTQSSNNGFQSSMPKTFNGERGGSATDDDLLAELRAISAQSSKTDRFGEDESTIGMNTEDNSALTVPQPNEKSTKKPEALPASSQNHANFEAIDKPKGTSSSFNLSASGSRSTEINQSIETASSTPTFVVTNENFEESLKSKKWNMRKAAYDYLNSLLTEKIGNKKGTNTLDGNAIFTSLDDIVVEIVRDTNISALDVSLALALSYADFCTAASNPEQAAKICESLLKGPAFSARPTTLKLAQDLLLKLMEVGRDGFCNVHSIVQLLLSDGLGSKKPKVVLNSINTILEAVAAFGATSLPLSVISTSISKAVSHANGSVRENGIKIIAELCRAMGSKEHLEHVISSMKPAQISDLDKLLNEQQKASRPTVGFRFKDEDLSSSLQSSSLAEIKAASAEETAKKFASRAAIDLITEIKDTDFETKMKEVKWSEKVAALDILIKCGGEKPYKLCQPSTTVDYGPIIHSLKQLLGHSHFAVKSKAMLALGILAEGVGEKLYSNLRPLLHTLLGFSRDKKLIGACNNCLDSFFGNVIGFNTLLHEEDAITSAVNEKSHPLVRKGALEFLKRCIERSNSFKSLGSLDAVVAKSIVQLCFDKLNDQDSDVRKQSSNIVKLLLESDDSRIKDLTDSLVKSLEKINPRAYKTIIQAVGDATSGVASPPRKSSLPKVSRKKGIPKVPRSPNGKVNQGTRKMGKRLASRANSAKINHSVADFNVEVGDVNLPDVEEALASLSQLNIPNWHAAEDEGGIILGLKSSNWKFRKAAIDGLALFSKSINATNIDKDYAINTLVVIKAFTKNFKESNFNLSKAIMEVFLAVCGIYLTCKRELEVWICDSAITIAVGKMSDKKLSGVASKLVTSLCEVQVPEIIVALAIKNVKSIKSPLPHEALLLWSTCFFVDFGAVAVGKSVPTCVNWALKECVEANVKVRKAALALIGEMHTQMGPVLKALVMSNSNLESSARSQVEDLLDSSPYDPGASKIVREKQSFIIESSNSINTESGSSLDIEIPKTDLVASLPSKCLSRMRSKEGKTSWKTRKEALDEVESACLECAGLVSTTPSCLKSLVELCRALKERLSDLQSNLKPLAARNIGHILGSVDSSSQIKLGKIVCGPLIGAAMNDNKKLMRDAAMDALEKCTEKLSIEGGGVNSLTMELFMSALVAELGLSEYKAIGLPSVLNFAAKKAEYFPDFESTSSSKGKALETQFASMTISCLTSSKSDARSAAESLLKECVRFGTLSAQSIEKTVQKLVEADQRNVRRILKSLGIDGPKKLGDSRRAPAPKRPASSRNRVKDKKSGGGSRPSSRAGRESLLPSKQTDGSLSIELSDLLTDPSFFPLISSNGLTTTKAQRFSLSNRKRDHWPEYPEEPSGKDVLHTLKKAWSPLLPSPSIGVLFPPGGITRQEDASNGCELLSRAMTLLQANGEEIVLIDQLDLINKWLAFAICSRESTVGMQALISFLLKMFALLRHKRYQMTDTEGGILLPYLIEKAGAAKGRFRDMLHDLLSSLASDDIYPLIKYGSVTCTSVIERSATAKTRALATRECNRCVEKCGLVGIGKKGVQLTAKSLSEEHISENRLAYLDLIETIIQKMNGDLQKYLKICGNSNLSGRAREMVEERWSKHGQSRVSKSSSSSSRRSFSSAGSEGHSYGDQSNSRSKFSNESGSRQNSLRNELPPLNLQIGTLGRNTQEILKCASNDDSEGPFTFSFNSLDSNLAISPKRTDVSSLDKTNTDNSYFAPDNSNDNKTEYQTLNDDGSSKREVGAAASLRERLRQIRDKHRSVTEEGIRSLPKPPVTAHAMNSPALPVEDTIFHEIMRDVDKLLKEPTPLGDKENITSIALAGLRKIHASLTINASLQTTNEDPVILQELRHTVRTNLPSCVERLSSVLEFGFKCGTLSDPDGLSIPLLSVAIAALMAIFLDKALSDMIPPKVLILVIHRATSGLLDRRLAGNSKRKNQTLDTSTSKKMVKAINKLAIQATYGAKRHISLQALFSLQLQFCSAAIEEGVAMADASNIHNRMSRIITKLFSRVIKAEESEDLPFSGKDLEFNCLLSALEDVLGRTCSVQGPNGSNSITGNVIDSDFSSDDRMMPILTMGRTLMIHILKSKCSTGRAEKVKNVIDTLKFPKDSLTRRLYVSCCSELGLEKIVDVEKDKSPKEKSPGRQRKGYDVDQLSELIFAIGRAEEDEGRMYAFDDLREFMNKYEKVDIESHLSTISAPFRKYILDELKNPSPFRPPLSSSSRSVMSGISGSYIENGAIKNSMDTGTEGKGRTSQTMSEKLRYLKSKISAAEATAQSVIDSSNVTEVDDSSTLYSHQSRETSSIFRMEQKQRNGYTSLRERLAATALKRANITAENNSSNRSVSGSSTFEKAALGNAAALRARLESVRRIHELN